MVAIISGDYRYIKNVLTAYQPNMPLLSVRAKELLDILPPERKFVLYGAGGRGSQVLQHFANDSRFMGFCSNNVSKQASGYLGWPVMSPKQLLDRKDVSVLVCAPSAKDEIMRRLADGDYPQEYIFDLDALSMVVAPGQYFGPEFITYEDEEVFVDAGCYHLEDSLNMRKYCKCLKRVYAFEPDPANYRKCVERKQESDFSAAEIFPFGTWSERKTISFTAKGNTSSKVSENGGEFITVVPIDEMIPPEDRVTFIKMDVEGAELESLKGAANIIRRDRPKLAICIYHKPEDMVEIPLWIKEFSPEYKLYIRMHANDGSETVCYAIPPKD